MTNIAMKIKYLLVKIFLILLFVIFVNTQDCIFDGFDRGFPPVFVNDTDSKNLTLVRNLRRFVIRNAIDSILVLCPGGMTYNEESPANSADGGEAGNNKITTNLADGGEAGNNKITTNLADGGEAGNNKIITNLADGGEAGNNKKINTNSADGGVTDDAKVITNSADNNNLDTDSPEVKANQAKKTAEEAQTKFDEADKKKKEAAKKLLGEPGNDDLQKEAVKTEQEAMEAERNRDKTEALATIARKAAEAAALASTPEEAKVAAAETAQAAAKELCEEAASKVSAAKSAYDDANREKKNADDAVLKGPTDDPGLAEKAKVAAGNTEQALKNWNWVKILAEDLVLIAAEKKAEYTIAKKAAEEAALAPTPEAAIVAAAEAAEAEAKRLCEDAELKEQAAKKKYDEFVEDQKTADGNANQAPNDQVLASIAQEAKTKTEQGKKDWDSATSFAKAMVLIAAEKKAEKDGLTQKGRRRRNAADALAQAQKNADEAEEQLPFAQAIEKAVNERLLLEPDNPDYITEATQAKQALREAERNCYRANALATIAKKAAAEADLALTPEAAIVAAAEAAEAEAKRLCEDAELKEQDAKNNYDDFLKKQKKAEDDLSKAPIKPLYNLVQQAEADAEQGKKDWYKATSIAQILVLIVAEKKAEEAEVKLVAAHTREAAANANLLLAPDNADYITEATEAKEAAREAENNCDKANALATIAKKAAEGAALAPTPEAAIVAAAEAAEAEAKRLCEDAESKKQDAKKKYDDFVEDQEKADGDASLAQEAKDKAEQGKKDWYRATSFAQALVLIAAEKKAKEAEVKLVAAHTREAAANANLLLAPDNADYITEATKAKEAAREAENNCDKANALATIAKKAAEGAALAPTPEAAIVAAAKAAEAEAKRLCEDAESKKQAAKKKYDDFVEEQKKAVENANKQPDDKGLASIAQEAKAKTEQAKKDCERAKSFGEAMGLIAVEKKATTPAVPGAPTPAVPGPPKPAVPGAPTPAVPGPPKPAVPGAPTPAVPGAPTPAVPGAPTPAVPGAPTPPGGTVDEVLAAALAAAVAAAVAQIAVDNAQKDLERAQLELKNNLDDQNAQVAVNAAQSALTVANDAVKIANSKKEDAKNAVGAAPSADAALTAALAAAVAAAVAQIAVDNAQKDLERAQLELNNNPTDQNAKEAVSAAQSALTNAKKINDGAVEEANKKKQDAKKALGSSGGKDDGTTITKAPKAATAKNFSLECVNGKIISKLLETNTPVTNLNGIRCETQNRFEIFMKVGYGSCSQNYYAIGIKLYENIYEFAQICFDLRGMKPTFLRFIARPVRIELNRYRTYGALDHKEKWWERDQRYKTAAERKIVKKKGSTYIDLEVPNYNFFIPTHKIPQLQKERFVAHRDIVFYHEVNLYPDEFFGHFFRGVVPDKLKLQTTIGWDALFLGNWRIFLGDLLLRIKDVSYEIYIGTSHIAKAPKSINCLELSDFILYDNGREFAIPQYIWAFLLSPSDRFVVVGVNTPYYPTMDKTNELPCESICNEIEWLRLLKQFEKLSTFGLIYCCPVHSVDKFLQGFPKFDYPDED